VDITCDITLKAIPMEVKKDNESVGREMHVLQRLPLPMFCVPAQPN
jgi:hypothetical protein